MQTATPAPVNYSPEQFVTRNRGAYQQLFEQLRMPWRTDLLNAALASTVPSEDQRKFAENFTVPEEDRAAILATLTSMGWFNGLPLMPGDYYALLMQGLGFKGMIIMVTNTLNDLDRLGDAVKFIKHYGLTGQRARKDSLDGTVEKIYGTLTDKVKAHQWVVDQMKLMDEPDCYEPFKGAFATEFELFILAFLVATDAACDVEDFVDADDTGVQFLDEVPARTIESVRLWLVDSDLEFTIINAPAERRGRGKCRATSKNNVKHFMEKYGVPDGSKVVMTASRNGTLRVLATSETMLHSFNNTVEIIGYAGAPDGDPMTQFVAILNETMNMYMKAGEALLNRFLTLKRGDNVVKPLNSLDLKLIYARLVNNQTEAMVALILFEVITGTVPRG